MAKKKQDKFTRSWIMEVALQEIKNYAPGDLTIRGLHYRLVSHGMTNTIQHYKRVVSAMIEARWNGEVDFETFSDFDREMIGRTHFEPTNVGEQVNEAEQAIDAWMKYYSKNRWENQPYYPEVFIEKKALQGVFRAPCQEWNVTLGACKGYPSLTFLNDAYHRLKNATYTGSKPIILYFGDYDPSGEDIPRSIGDNLYRMGVEVEIRRIALSKADVIERGLPPAPIKEGDSRSAKWEGLGQVELDAVEPNDLKKMCWDAIHDIFDRELYQELLQQEKEEKVDYVAGVKKFIKTLI